MTNEECGCHLASLEDFFSADDVLLVMRVVAVVSYFALASWCLTLGYWMKCRSVSFLGQKLNAVRSWCGTRTTSDEDKKVDELVSANRERRGWELVILNGAVMTLLTFNALRSLHANGVWQDASDDDMANIMFDSASVNSLVWSMITLFVFCWGRCSTNVLNCLHVLFYIGVIVVHWSVSNTTSFSVRLAVTAAFRVLSAFILGHVPLTLVLSAAHCTSIVARVASTPLSGATVMYILWAELAICLISIAGSGMSESILRREMKAILQANFAARAERTAKELLTLVCDAVVTLDEGLCVQLPSPALAALLFNPSHQAFCGVAFEELVCSGDRARFREFITCGSLPQCLHLHMRDVSGARVAVQLFHSPFEGILDKMSHLIGIREETEGQQLRQLPDTLEQDGSFVAINTLGAHAGGPDVVSLSSGSSDCLACEIVVIIDEYLTVLECTPCCTAICGPVQGPGMLDWVVGSRVGFLGWCQNAFNQLVNGDVPPPTQITLAPPHTRLVGPIRATCEARFPDGGIGDLSNEESFRLRLILSDVSTRRRMETRIGTRRAQVARLSL